MPSRHQAAPKAGCCIPKLPPPGDIPRLRVVPDTPTPATITVTPATLTAVYDQGWTDCAAALAGP